MPAIRQNKHWQAFFHIISLLTSEGSSWMQRAGKKLVPLKASLVQSLEILSPFSFPNPHAQTSLWSLDSFYLHLWTMAGHISFFSQRRGENQTGTHTPDTGSCLNCVSCDACSSMISRMLKNWAPFLYSFPLTTICQVTVPPSLSKFLLLLYKKLFFPP